MRLRGYAASIALLALLASPAAADVVYVDNVSGDDLNDGAAARNEPGGRGPCRTIGRALKVARAGDRVVLAKNDQPYRESITLQGGRNSGAGYSSFVLDGNGATLDGSRPVPPDVWKHVEGGVFRFEPFYKHHQQLFLGPLPAARRRIDPRQGKLAELKPNEWCVKDHAIHFRPADGQAPQQLPLRFAVDPVGITLYEVHDVAIVNLTVQGFRIDGVNAHDDARDVTLSGLTCRGNGRAGVSIGGSSRAVVSGCLVGNNGEVQLRTEGRAAATVERTDLVAGDVPLWSNASGRLTIDGKAVGAAPEPANQ